MSTGTARRITFTVIGFGTESRYALVRGQGLGMWLRSHGVPATSSRVNKGFHVRQEHVADLVAQAQHAGVRVVIKEGS